MQNIQPLTTNKGDILLEVNCGVNQGLMFVNRLCQGSKGECISYNNTWYTPNEFQFICGRENAKDWKRSINHNGKSLKYLMNKGILTPHPVTCNCQQSRSADNNQEENTMNLNLSITDTEIRLDEQAVSTRSETPSETIDIDTSSTASPPGGAVMDSDDADKPDNSTTRDNITPLARDDTTLTSGQRTEVEKKLDTKLRHLNKQKKTRGIDLSSFNNSRYNEFLRYIKTLQIGLEQARPPGGAVTEQSTSWSPVTSSWPADSKTETLTGAISGATTGQRMIELTKPPNLHLPSRPSPSSSSSRSQTKRRLSAPHEEQIVDLSVKRERQADSTAVYNSISSSGISSIPSRKINKHTCINCLQLPWCSQTDVTNNDPLSWTTDDVFRFVSKVPGCEEYNEVFHDQMIDGFSLSLLNLDHLLDKLGMKLGPALTLKASISRLMNPECHVCVSGDTSS
ncbi:uncharacterized protein LOC141908672 [Tubulanus polymorphus]|uniref:uncharacterized protein LOC141908672 n=1 Tax=Tubulanus polymorphus TaxID=672921 RepID=UPI003DA23C1D